jgi:DNA mismatch repair protein MutS
LPDVCGRVAGAAGGVWDDLEAWIERVDITRCLAIEASSRGYVEPQLCPPAADGGAVFSASCLRHPLIESMMTRTEYISHNVQFDAGGRGWLVYGMNASGKSSLMKAIGIAIHLAQCGCFVPAAACVISPFTGLYTRIINRDDLWAGMSSFAVEMSEMREFLDTAGRGTMILGDELCNGTESQSAKAIVAAGIDWLADRGARYFFATHLHGLLDVLPPAEDLALKVWHLRVEYDAQRDRLIYQRSLRPGPGSTLYGLEVARAMHLPVAFLEKAHKYRRALIGTVNEEEATASSWNSAVVRRICEVCGHEIVRDLEVHHIRPRAEARSTGSRFADGAARDDMRNLVVVCQGCHDAHHAGKITIGPLQQTSAGPVRAVSSAPAVTTAATTAVTTAEAPATTNIFQQFAYTPPTPKQLGDEEVRTIIHVMKQYPALSIRQLAPKLRNDYEIEVEESVLRKIKRTGAA